MAVEKNLLHLSKFNKSDLLYPTKATDYNYKMRHFSRFLFITLAAIVLCPLASRAANPSESIDYRVMFKWGMINKKAGMVNLSTFDNAGGTTFNALLTARSAKWADAFYEVRDTLKGEMNSETLEPLFYEKITHEGGHFKHDRLNYRRSGDNVIADCHRIDRPDPKGKTTESSITLEAEGLTLDMLSSFYYMRRLNFPAMQPGESKVLTVFSGKRKETLTITYIGKENVKIDSETLPAYHIKFRFTGKGGKKTSDDMQAWISAADNRIPLKLVGKLPVGQVQCFYVPAK